MLKEEFIERLDEGVQAPTDKEYAVIETVYTFHPAIDEVTGKTQIALLYNTFGMSVINDMLDKALKMKNLESRYHKAMGELNEIKCLINELKGV